MGDGRCQQFGGVAAAIVLENGGSISFWRVHGAASLGGRLTPRVWLSEVTATWINSIDGRRPSIRRHSPIALWRPMATSNSLISDTVIAATAKPNAPPVTSIGIMGSVDSPVAGLPMMIFVIV